MTPAEAFVTRLRQHRQRGRVTIEAIAAQTRINRDALEALEANDLSTWPRGLYARAWIRAYADAVGLDPVDTVDEFCRIFPLADRRCRATMEEMAAIVAVESSYWDDFRPEVERRAGAVVCQAAVEPAVRSSGAGSVRVADRMRGLLVEMMRGLRARVASSRSR